MSQQISFRTLLNRTVRTCGMRPESLAQDLAESFASWLESRVEEAWKYTIWPQTCALEVRTITRPATGDDDTDADTAPTADSTVVTADSELITVDSEPAASAAAVSAEALASSGEDLASSATLLASGYRTAEAAAEPYSISFTAGTTRIGELLNVWREDPRLYPGAREMAFWLPIAGMAYLPTDAPTTVYVRFRKVAPVFSAQAYDSETVYAPGEVFLFTDGECYLVANSVPAGETPASCPDDYLVQRIPVELARFAEIAARADWLMDDGQEDKAAAQLTRAQKILADRMGDLTVLQHQTTCYSAA